MRSADGRDPMQGTGRGSRRSRRPASNDSCPTRYAAVTRRCLRGAADALTGWLAHFTAFAGGWDERAVSLGIAVLLAAVLPLDWALACACLGRWLGAALVVAVFCPVAYLTMGGYADGWLTLLLLLEVLALAEPATERLDWLAASVVSLLKWEGWLLGAAVAVACTLVFPHPRKRRGTMRWAPLCVFAAGLIHLRWDLRHGLPPSDYSDTPWNLVVAQLLHVEGYTRCHALLWTGIVGGIGAVMLGLPDRFSRLALGLAVASAAFAIGVLTLSPFDPSWHVWTAADRLLLPAAAFALLAALATVAAAVSEAEATSPVGARAPAVAPRRARHLALAFLTARYGPTKRAALPGCLSEFTGNAISIREPALNDTLAPVVAPEWLPAATVQVNAWSLPFARSVNTKLVLGAPSEKQYRPVKWPLIETTCWTSPSVELMKLTPMNWGAAEPVPPRAIPPLLKSSQIALSGPVPPVEPVLPVAPVAPVLPAAPVAPVGPLTP